MDKKKDNSTAGSRSNALCRRSGWAGGRAAGMARAMAMKLGVLSRLSDCQNSPWHRLVSYSPQVDELVPGDGSLEPWTIIRARRPSCLLPRAEEREGGSIAASAVEGETSSASATGRCMQVSGRCVDVWMVVADALKFCLSWAASGATGTAPEAWGEAFR
jgi:hypothetical protein